MSESSGAANKGDSVNNDNNGKRQRAFFILGAIIVIAAIAYAAYWLLVARYREYTDDAYVAGNLVQVTPQVVGTVISIGADDTDFVKQGDVLVSLGSTDAQIALERAQAELGDAVRQVHKLFIGTRQYEAGVEMGVIGVQKAAADLQRREGMDEPGAVAREDIEHARQSNALSAAGLELAQAQLDSNRALTANTEVVRHPQVLAAAAHVRDAYLALRRTQIPSPITGYVARRAVQVGQRVNPGDALLAVVPLQEIWIDANFKEMQLRHIRIGQPVKVIADLYGDDIEYRGKIVGLGLGTGSAFSLLPAQNATGNWIKVVQRVPVRIELESDDVAKHPLRIGLSALVTIDTHRRDGAVLATQTRTAPAYSTTVYDQELHAADAMIAKIIDANLNIDNAAPNNKARRSTARKPRA